MAGSVATPRAASRARPRPARRPARPPPRGDGHSAVNRRTARSAGRGSAQHGGQRRVVGGEPRRPRRSAGSARRAARSAVDRIGRPAPGGSLRPRRAARTPAPAVAAYRQRAGPLVQHHQPGQHGRVADLHPAAADQLAQHRRAEPERSGEPGLVMSSTVMTGGRGRRAARRTARAAAPRLRRMAAIGCTHGMLTGTPLARGAVRADRCVPVRFSSASSSPGARHVAMHLGDQRLDVVEALHAAQPVRRSRSPPGGRRSPPRRRARTPRRVRSRPENVGLRAHRDRRRQLPVADARTGRRRRRRRAPRRTGRVAMFAVGKPSDRPRRSPCTTTPSTRCGRPSAAAAASTSPASMQARM